MAHVMEHVAWQYRREIEKQLGAALPPMPEKDGENVLPPMIEAQLSQLAAQAAAKLLQKDVAEAQAAQAAAQAQDPLIQMQQKDLQIKEGDLERKKLKDLADSAAKSDAQKLREKEVTGRQSLDALRILTDAGKSKDQLEQQHDTEAKRMLLDAAKSKDQMDNQSKTEASRMALDLHKHQNPPPQKKEPAKKAKKKDSK